MRLLSVVLCLCAALSGASRVAPVAPLRVLPPLTLAGGDLPRFAHPNAVASLGLRTAALFDSRLLKEAAGPMFGPALDQMMAELRRIEMVHVSVAAPVKTGGEPDILVLLEGDFRGPTPKFLEQSRGMPAYRIGTRLILLGQPASAAAAHARLAATGTASELPVADFWLKADLSQLPPLPANEMVKGLSLKDLKSVALTVSMKDDLVMDAKLETADTAAAEKVLALLKNAMNKAEAPTEGVELVADGAAVRMAARMKQADLEASMKKAMAVRKAAVPPPPPPRKPTVWGLTNN